MDVMHLLNDTIMHDDALMKAHALFMYIDA